jgi:hypothetical protein
VADQPALIDVPIPDTGWERVHLDPDTQDPWLLDVLSGPAPAWLYDAGCRLIVDPSIPQGIVRIHTTQPADWLAYL